MRLITVDEAIPKGSIVRYRLESTNPFDKGAKQSKITYEVMGLDGLKMRIRSKNNHILYQPLNDNKIVKAEVSDADHKKDQIYVLKKTVLEQDHFYSTFSYLIYVLNRTGSQPFENR